MLSGPVSLAGTDLADLPCALHVQKVIRCFVYSFHTAPKGVPVVVDPRYLYLPLCYIR